MKRLALGTIVALSLAAASTAPAHAGTRAYSRPNYAKLIQATRDFGYWMTYPANAHMPPSKLVSPAIVNANILRHTSIRARRGSTVGLITGRMHLMNIPGGYRFHIDSYTEVRAVETLHWLFGTNPHTPIVRLEWKFSPAGWSITQVAFLRNS